MTTELDLSSEASLRAYIAAHPGLEAVVGDALEGPTADPLTSVDRANTTPFPPQWRDLLRLHRLVRWRRVTTVMEFGVGFSTAVMADALARNEAEDGEFVRTNLRRGNAFEIHSVDDTPDWIATAAGRIPEALRGRVTLLASPTRMTTFAGRICTEYDRLPNVTPDLVYVDGPGQHSVLGEVAGITTAHQDRVPMSCDLLKIEHFLLPGCLIVVDGRTANARFLRANFQRTWAYEHDREGDVHLFELREPPLGRWNQRQVDHCLGEAWAKSL